MARSAGALGVLTAVMVLSVVGCSGYDSPSQVSDEDGTGTGTGGSAGSKPSGNVSKDEAQREVKAAVAAAGLGQLRLSDIGMSEVPPVCRSLKGTLATEQAPADSALDKAASGLTSRHWAEKSRHKGPGGTERNLTKGPWTVSLLPGNVRGAQPGSGGPSAPASGASAFPSATPFTGVTVTITPHCTPGPAGPELDG